MSKSPEIKATMEELINAAPWIARVLAVKVGEQLRYHAMKLDSHVESQLKHFGKRHDALIQEFGGVERKATGAERAAHGPNAIFYHLGENEQAFLAKKRELLAVVVTIPWGPITREMVAPYDEITGQVCKGLGPLFELDPVADAEKAA